jgi:hypothetical protein
MFSPYLKGDFLIVRHPKRSAEPFKPAHIIVLAYYNMTMNSLVDFQHLLYFNLRMPNEDELMIFHMIGGIEPEISPIGNKGWWRNAPNAHDFSINVASPSMTTKSNANSHGILIYLR